MIEEITINCPHLKVTDHVGVIENAYMFEVNGKYFIDLFTKGKYRPRLHNPNFDGILVDDQEMLSLDGHNALITPSIHFTDFKFLEITENYWRIEIV